MSFVGVASEKDVFPDGLSVNIARSGYGRNRHAALGSLFDIINLVHV